MAKAQEPTGAAVSISVRKLIGRHDSCDPDGARANWLPLALAGAFAAGVAVGWKGQGLALRRGGAGGPGRGAVATGLRLREGEPGRLRALRRAGGQARRAAQGKPNPDREARP